MHFGNYDSLPTLASLSEVVGIVVVVLVATVGSWVMCGRSAERPA